MQEQGQGVKREDFCQVWKCGLIFHGPTLTPLCSSSAGRGGGGARWPAARSRCCQMHQGPDRGEPSPSGPLQARLKTTPAPSLAPKLRDSLYLFLSSFFCSSLVLVALQDLSLLMILTLLRLILVSTMFNLGFIGAISYTQQAEANWF